jgi:hypothetical protein
MQPSRNAWKMDDPGAIVFSSSDKGGHEKMIYSNVTNPRKCLVKKPFKSWRRAQQKLENPCLEKEMFNYHTLRKNGNFNFRVAEDGQPARRETLFSLA